MDRCRVAVGHARRKRQTNRRIVADGVVRPQAPQVNSLDPRLHASRRDVKIQSVPPAIFGRPYAASIVCTKGFAKVVPQLSFWTRRASNP